MGGIAEIISVKDPELMGTSGLFSYFYLDDEITRNNTLALEY